jgi:voltage-gated potassium channel
MLFLRTNRFKIVLFALCSLLLTPLTASLIQSDIASVGLFNLTLVSFASFITAVRRIPRLLTTLIAASTILLVWAEYILPDIEALRVARIFSLLALYVMLAYILIRNFLDTKDVNLHVIMGAMGGFIVIGFIGGSLFEIMQYFHPNSINLNPSSGGFDLYYYSFISMTTVGYGDITPLTAAAKSLTVLLSLVGQFYMTIGIALFVGKHLSTPNTTD